MYKTERMGNMYDERNRVEKYVENENEIKRERERERDIKESGR